MKPAFAGRTLFPISSSLIPVLAVALAICANALTAEGPHQYLRKKDDWFRGEDGRRIAANILTHQSKEGGFPKNTDTTAKPFDGDKKTIHGSFDNSATTDELRFLARVYNATQDAACKTAFLKGIDFILIAQYPTGGWPQSYPTDKSYHRHITFNDWAMVRLMEFLREVYAQDAYAFAGDEKRKAARDAFDRGIQCILKCQIVVNGTPTAWCAQHDELDYSPRPGRKYELVSLSGAESVGIVRFLMSLDNPGPEISRAVQGSVAWFERAKLTGIRTELVDDPKAPKGKDLRIIADPAASPLWARFYEIGTNTPIYCDRDGIAKHDLAEIGYERRNGYRWLGDWPRDLLQKDYPQWKEKWAARMAEQPK